MLRWTSISRILWAISMTSFRCTASWSVCIRIGCATLRSFSGIIFIGRLIWQWASWRSRFWCLSGACIWSMWRCLRRGNRRSWRCFSSCHWWYPGWNWSSCCLRWSRVWRWFTWTLDSCWWQCKGLIAYVFFHLKYNELDHQLIKMWSVKLIFRSIAMRMQKWLTIFLTCLRALLSMLPFTFSGLYGGYIVISFKTYIFSPCHVTSSILES